MRGTFFLSGKLAMDEYKKEIIRNAWCCIEASYEMGEDAWQFGEYIEDSAREIAVYFDLPYLSVKEDLQTEIKEWDMELSHANHQMGYGIMFKTNASIRRFLHHQKLMHDGAPPKLVERYECYVWCVAKHEFPKTFKQWLGVED